MATLVTVHAFQSVDRRFHELTLNADSFVEVCSVETACYIFKASPDHMNQLIEGAERLGIRTVVIGANRKSLHFLKESALELKFLIKNAEEIEAKTIRNAIDIPSLRKFMYL